MRVLIADTGPVTLEAATSLTEAGHGVFTMDFQEWLYGLSAGDFDLVVIPSEYAGFLHDARFPTEGRVVGWSEVHRLPNSRLDAQLFRSPEALLEYLEVAYVNA